MSSAGEGAIVAVAAVPIVAAAGITILIGRGLIWCGEKLEENYRNACQEWTGLADRVRAENMQNVQEMSSYLTDQMEYLATSAALTFSEISKSGELEEQKRQLNEAFARAQQALASAQQLTQSRAETRQTLLSRRLQTEIAAAEGLLPAHEIERARVALQATPAEMQQALKRLQEAWERVSEAGNVRNHAIRQTQQTLQAVSARLSAIDALRQNAQSSSQLAFASQQSSIVALVREAETFLNVQPGMALEKARAAEQEARRLTEIISGETIAAWSNQQKELNRLRGMVASLTRMLEEARSIQLLDAGQLQSLTERVQQAQNRLEQADRPGASLTARQLARLQAGVNLVKQEVFALVGSTQQRNIAQTIATTLAELGFRSNNGSSPVLKQQGDSIHIQAITQPETAEQRDEKVISFDIGPNGTVSYDFSGYIGDSCLSDAQRVFSALRQKGIFLLDNKSSARLQQLPNASISAETLQDARFTLEPAQNKTQAELAEALLRVLQRMGYPTIQQRTVGGSIELEAFKGSKGYRVVLAPDGETHILKDAQGTDVSMNASDPLATEAQQIIQQAQEVEEEESETKRHRPTAFRQKKRQALE
ncbi:MAG TPA: hypothetical protein VFV38_44160 [Ktedonobacteraceae bacterium]|nr:hypothetical protein [Ktedonobacteraceae bacterium]